MKIIAFYLPQYYRTKENDEWWGEGFTEWTSMKKARSLFKDHYQPRIPLNQNYYDLLDESVMKWQIDLAKKYGVYGFCVYHYWSEQGMLLDKPMENFLKNKELDIPFCLSWANETWSNTWATDARNPKVLWKQTYGDKKEWERHFNYLLPFFQDSRYIKEDGHPIFVIYRPEKVDKLNEMLDYFNDLARKHGFKGIYFASQQKEFIIDHHDDSRMKYKIEYSPSIATYKLQNGLRRQIDRTKISIINFIEKYTPYSIPKMRKLVKVNYDKLWGALLKLQPSDSKLLPGAFTDWDNTPRYGNHGSVYIGASPEKFYHYFKQQIIHAREDYKTDKIFIFAWNEWSEGGYLEPDEKWGYGYLEAIKRALTETNEWET